MLSIQFSWDVFKMASNHLLFSLQTPTWHLTTDNISSMRYISDKTSVYRYNMLRWCPIPVVKNFQRPGTISKAHVDMTGSVGQKLSLFSSKPCKCPSSSFIDLQCASDLCFLLLQPAVSRISLSIRNVTEDLISYTELSLCYPLRNLPGVSNYNLVASLLPAYVHFVCGVTFRWLGLSEVAHEWYRTLELYYLASSSSC